ncbi:MAG TPA: carboxylesterase family protein [Ktedonobacteraceae bacterium]|nr:carboxylesterase family protein [Ktedonobacteraceae bacterium]
MKRYFKVLATLLSIFAVTALASLALDIANVNATSRASAVVKTLSGAVRGIVNNDTRQFLGIPYAAPPTGNLRWKAPQPLASWTGVRDATKFGSVCLQVGSPLTGVPEQGVVGNEDCLFLNVYTPAVVQSHLPVMVWIHGGGFTGGTGNVYDPGVIVKKGHVIVVTINYRLSSLGYLALPGLSAETRLGSSGNYGLQDQQAALQWVRANIARFGGNAGNVTIFGESAGGASVCEQIVSPFARGLFQRAITESGPCANPAPTLTASSANGAAFAASLGCSGTASAVVACMRALPPATVIAVATANPNRLTLTFSPNIDGVILPQQVRGALSSGKYNHVPVIEGTNRNEDTIFVLAQISATGKAIPLTAEQYQTTVQRMFGTNAPQVLAQYPVTSSVSPDQALANLVTDARFACPANTANTLFSAGTFTFAYEFSDPNPFQLLQVGTTPPDFELGDAHADEITYVFQGMLGGTTIPLTPAQLALSDQIIRYWTTFAATGNPNSFKTPFWPLYHARTHLVQALTSAGYGSRPISQFSKEHLCSFWATLGI